MADTAVAAEGERYDEDVANDWSTMNPEQKEAAVAKAVAAAAARGTEDLPVKEPVKAADSDEETTKTPARGDVTPAGGDAGKADKKVETEGADKGEEEESEADWLDNDTRDYANALGVSDEFLSEFDSREDLDRHLRIFNRQTYEAAKAVRDKPAAQETVLQPQPVRQPTVQPPAQTAAKDQGADPFADLTQFRIKEEFLDPEVSAPVHKFVETAAGAIKSQAATIQDLHSRLVRFEEYAQQEAVAANVRAATASAKQINPDRYGKPGDAPTEEQKANLVKVLETHWIHANGLIVKGLNPAPTPSFLKAADNLVFGEENLKLQKRRITDKLRKQSTRRTGAGAGKSVPPPDTSKPTWQRRAENPDVSAKFKELAHPD